MFLRQYIIICSSFTSGFGILLYCTLHIFAFSFFRGIFLSFFYGTLPYVLFRILSLSLFVCFSKSNFDVLFVSFFLSLSLLSVCEGYITLLQYCS